MTTLSIITPVFNSAPTIADCLQSIDRQSLKPLEHIIIDAASTDSTLAIVDGLPAGYRRVISAPDDGMYDAMNKGLRVARGDVIGILNGDDIYSDAQVLYDVSKTFDDSGADCCYGDLRYVDYENTSKTVRLWKSGTFNPAKFRWGWMPPHPTFFVRRQIYEEYGGFDLQLGTAADYELMLRLLVKHSCTTTYIPRVLVDMRVGGASNESVSRRLKANRMDKKAWNVNGLKPLPWTFFCKPLRKLRQWVLK